MICYAYYVGKISFSELAVVRKGVRTGSRVALKKPMKAPVLYEIPSFGTVFTDHRPESGEVSLHIYRISLRHCLIISSNLAKDFQEVYFLQVFPPSPACNCCMRSTAPITTRFPFGHLTVVTK
jgi:hypothetical protein